MSQANVELVRAYVVAWNEADVDAYLAVTDPALVFRTAGVFLSHEPVYHGHDGFRAFWETFHDAWDRLDLEIARLEDLGDRVLALLRFHARMSRSPWNLVAASRVIISCEGNRYLRGGGLVELAFDREGELGEVAVADDLAELPLGFEHPGGGPAQAHFP